MKEKAAEYSTKIRGRWYNKAFISFHSLAMDHLEQPHWKFSHPTKPSSPLNAFGKIISAGVALTAAGCITYGTYQQEIDAAFNDLCTLVQNTIGEVLNDENGEQEGDEPKMASIGIKDVAQSE